MLTLFDMPKTEKPAKQTAKQKKRADFSQRAPKEPRLPSRRFVEKMTRQKQKNRALGSTASSILPWDEYLENGYQPMSADWCLEQLAAMAVPFALDENGGLWFAHERLSITAGMHCSIWFRRAEIAEILRNERDMLATLKGKRSE